MIRLYQHSPNDNLGADLTVRVEHQGIDISDFDLGMVRMELTGRSSIIIEGTKEKIQPYLDVIEPLMRKEVNHG